MQGTGPDSDRLLASPQPDSGTLRRVLYILALDPRGKFGSLEEQVLLLGRAFRDRGSLLFPVFLAPLDQESAAQYQQEGLSHGVLDLRSFRVAQFRKLVKLVQENHIEVVHWSFYHPLLNPYLWLLSVVRPRVEHYYTDHISRPSPKASVRLRDPKSRIKEVLLRRYRKILCVSDFVCSQHPGVGESRRQVLYHFINTDRFRPDEAKRREVRRELGVGEEFVALTVAHLIREKGVDVAIRATAELPAGSLLWIIGQGPEEAALRSLADGLGIASRVRFLGHCRFVQSFMQAADCAICPSLWAEAAGLVNLEAPACGIPVVASRVGGIPEFIEDGRNGFLFAPGDHKQLADRIRRLIDDQAGRKAMGDAARSLAVERYSIASRLGEHLALYESAPQARGHA